MAHRRLVRPRATSSRSGQHPAPLRGRMRSGACSTPTRCGMIAANVDLIDDELRAARVPTPSSCELLLQQRRARAGAAAHERDRRARRVHPRIRAHRRDDAVQHVPPLHGGRAHHHLHLGTARHRDRAAGGIAAGGHRHPAARGEPPRPLYRAAVARHRQGPPARPFRGGRRDRRGGVPAPGPAAGRGGNRGLAGAQSPGDVGLRAKA